MKEDWQMSKLIFAIHKSLLILKNCSFFPIFFLILILLTFVIYQNIINLQRLVFTTTFWLLLLVSLSSTHETFIRFARRSFLLEILMIFIHLIFIIDCWRRSSTVWEWGGYIIWRWCWFIFLLVQYLAHFFSNYR